jgi:hypothetical protein
MDLRELTDLITIRQYLADTRGSYSIDRAAINELDSVLVSLDKKIVELIRSSDFKAHVKFQGKAEEPVPIRSGLKK